MLIKDLNKKILAVLLSSTFVLSSFGAYSSYAADSAEKKNDVKVEEKAKDEKKEETKKEIPSEVNVSSTYNYDTKVAMPADGELTVNVESQYTTGKGYLMVYVEEKVCKDRKKMEPLYIQNGNDKTYLINDYARYDADFDTDKAEYGFMIPCQLSKNISFKIVDPNKTPAFKGEFKIRVKAYTMGKDVIEPAPTLANINKTIEATASYEDEKVYEGFIFGNLGGKEVDTFFLRPDANSSRIRLNIGAKDENGFRYDNENKNNDFKIKYYNTEETYKKIKDNGVKDKNGDSKYTDDEYAEEEISVGSSNSVTLPWYPEHGIIEITLKQPNTFLTRISVEEESEHVNINGSSNTTTGTTENNNTTTDSSKKLDAVAKRYSGDNRYRTAIDLSKKMYNKSDIAVVASGENFADALSGGALASIHDAPILLVNEGSADDVRDELNRLKVDKVFILGGTKSISNKIEYKLTKDKNNKNREMIRLSGNNRYQTSLEVYKELTKVAGSNEHPVLVNGKNFADALSAGPVAAKDKRAVLLTDGHNVDSRIDKKNSNNIIVGGYSSMDSSFGGYRYYGKNRYETSANIANKHFKDYKKAMLTSGEVYPDGLAAMTLYRKYEGPLLLTEKKVLPSVIRNSIENNKTENVYIVGGTNSVSSKIENMFK